MKAFVLSLLLVSTLLFALGGVVSADDDVAVLKRRIGALLNESRALKAEGRHDAADVLVWRAHELAERLEARTHPHEPVPLTREQAERVLHGLEMGMEALEVLNHEKEWKALERLADVVRGRMKAAREEHPEMREARRQLELYRVAFHGLREAEMPEALARMEHAIHVMELNIEGRRDDEAQRIRREGPDRAERVELLRRAAKAWDGFGHESKAQALRELAEKMAAPLGRKSDRSEALVDVDRRALARRLEVLRLAQRALRAAEERRLVEAMERAIHVYELLHAGRQGDEVREAWKRAPKKRELAELLGHAAHLHAKAGDERAARFCKEMAGEVLGETREAAKGSGGNRKVHEQRRRLWKHVLAAFREAEKPELVERTKRILEVYAMTLDGREGEEVPSAFLRQVPKAREQAELAAAASHLYAGWKKQDQAHALMAFSHELATSEAAKQERDGSEAAELLVVRNEIRELRRRVEELQKALRRLERR